MPCVLSCLCWMVGPIPPPLCVSLLCSAPPAFADGAVAAIPLPRSVAGNRLSPRALQGLFRGAQEDTRSPLAPERVTKVSPHCMTKDMVFIPCHMRLSRESRLGGRTGISCSREGNPGHFLSSAQSRANAYTKEADYTPLGHKTVLQAPAFSLCKLSMWMVVSRDGGLLLPGSSRMV